MNILTYRRGAPIIIDLLVNDAGAYTPSAITCQMKLKLAVNSRPPPASAAAVATFAVTFTAASGQDKAYWRGEIDEDITAGLASGIDVADAMLLVAGEVIAVTDPIGVRLEPTVTPA